MKLENRIKAQKDYFATNITKSISFRKEQLCKLAEAVGEYSPSILRALKEDLNKSEYEAYLTEISLVKTEIKTALANLDRWSKPVKKKGNISVFPSESFSIYEPYGVALILSPWNYPFQLALAPVIGAMAAGNCVVLKTSRNARNTSRVIAEMINTTFEPYYICTVDDTTSYEKILSQEYDYIFFTGSPRVGRIIMRRASENLIPLTLELGGKSPCIVDQTADIKDAAKKIVWGKLINCGQTCVAPDYILVEESRKEALIEEMQRQIEKLYGVALCNPNYPRIVNLHHYMRLKRILEKEKEVIGGEVDEKNLRIAPAILPSATFSSESMKEEIFGPILPVLAYHQIEAVLDELKRRPKPLACYVFTGNHHFAQKIIQELPFGGGCINDCIMHVANHHLPFGGVGSSGMGKYHGYYSFCTFSHEKGILYNRLKWNNPFRFPPFTEEKLKKMKKFLKL